MRALLWALMLGWMVGPAVAQATEGIRWQWEPDQERRYLIRSNVRFAELFPARSRLNMNLRLAELETISVLRCSPTDLLNKRIVELSCTFDDVQFKGAPPERDAQRDLVKVLDEWDAALADVTLKIVMGLDGKVKTLDLDGYDTRLNRFREIKERLRLLLARSIAGLDLQLPKKGDDKGRMWTQKDSDIFALPSLVGSFGTARLDCNVAATDGSVVTIDREGGGSIRSGEMVGDAAEGQDRPRNTFSADMKGTATFDIETGELLTHDYAAKAEPTASSALATGVAAPFYIQVVSLKRVPNDREITLGPNLETVPGENGI